MPELTWLGTCNELNGAYAADGYARIKGMPGALVTTYAVGDLSAMNSVAGAYAEHAGMIHIVGMPARMGGQHSLGSPNQVLTGYGPKGSVVDSSHRGTRHGSDQAIYVGMATHIRKTHTILNDEKTMAAEIDRVIEVGMKSRLPVYIYIPMDTLPVLSDAKRLETPLDIVIKNDNVDMENEVIKATLEAIKNASSPAILADVLAIQHGGKKLTERLMNTTHFPTYSTPLFKGVVDETSPYFNGLYNGEREWNPLPRGFSNLTNSTVQVSFDGVAKAIESTDLVLSISQLFVRLEYGRFH